MLDFSAYRIHKQEKKVFGRIETINEKDLGPGDVLIRSELSSVNYKDALGATGTGRIVRHFPLIGGIDVVGTVEDSTNPQFQPGDTVIVTGCGLGEDRNGGYSEYVRLPAEILIPLPKGLTSKESMILGTAGFTAAICLYRMEQNGQKPEQGPVLVTGASGGVGMVATNLLANQGYHVIAVTGKASAKERLQKLGAKEVCSLEELQLGSRPLEKARWAGAIDNLGGEVIAGIARHINFLGNIATVGMAAGTEFHSSVMPYILRGVSILGISSNNCPLPLRKELWQRLSSEWKPTELPSLLEKTVTLSQLDTVFQNMLARKTQGRTIVECKK